MAQTVAELLSGSKTPETAPLPAGWTPVAAPDQPALPAGWTPAAAPAPRSMGDRLALGIRDVAEGTAGVADMLGSVITVPTNLAAQAMGHKPIFTGVEGEASKAMDALGAPKPRDRTERVLSAVGKGATAGLVTSGLGEIAAPVDGAVGVVARGLASSPVKNAVAGATGGASQQEAAEHGAGPILQTVAGLIGSLAGYGGAASAERVLPRPRLTLADTVKTTPKEVVIDHEGDLTEEGREAAIRHDVTAKELKAAYVKPEEVAAAYDAGEGAFTKPRQEPPIQAPVEAPVQEPVAPAPEAMALEPVEPAPEPAIAVPAAPTSARLAQAQSEGVQLTKGQATQDFDTQVAENDLKAGSGPAATQARMFADQQQQQLGQMVDNFKAAIGDSTGTAADRGKVVQDAIGALRDQGQKGVQAVYEQAKALPGSDAPLETGGILDAADRLILETPMDQGSKDALERAMAKFGVLPGKVEPSGRYASVVTDDGRRIRVLGNVEPLTLANAEDFRQALNAAWDSHGLMGKAIRALDDTVDEAIKSGAPGEKTAAYKAAREADKAQRAAFKGKDVVADIAAVKSGTKTPKLDPEDVVKKVLGGGKDSITDLKRVKAVLLSKPTEQSRAAWKALQSHAVGEIFDKALSPNGEFSGARLSSAIKQFGPAKLKLLLGEDEFNRLMKVNRIMHDATVPLANTTNPSGSGYAVIRFMTHHALTWGGTMLRFVPGVGPTMDAAQGLAKIGKDARIADRTLKGMREFTPQKALKADQPKPDTAQFARDFIDIAKSKEILSPLVAVEAQPQKEHAQ
jgi:hypothetical protein